MKRFLFGLLLAVTVFAQSTIVPQVNPLEVSPNFVVVLLFLWAGLHGTREGLIWAFFIGLMLDVITVAPLGTNGLALGTVALMAGPAQNRMFRSSIFFSIVLVIAASVVYGLVLYLLRDLRPNMFIVVQAFMHALLVPPAYLLIRLFDR
jgi:rod shape-determining protein MreD